MNRLLLMLRAQSGRKAGLAAALELAVSQIRDSAPDAQLRAATSIVDGPITDGPRGARSGRDFFDAAIDLPWVDGGLLQLNLLSDIRARVTDFVDPCLSAAIVGVEHVIIPGDDDKPALLIFPIRRVPKMSEAEFRSYWIDHHAQIPRRRGQPAGYRQLHADSRQSKVAAQAAGLQQKDFDGAAIVPTTDPNAILEYATRSDSQIESVADEANFIDHPRSIFGIYSYLR